MIRIERFLINCLCLAILACTWPVMSIAGAINLPQTGQTTCYDTDGNVIVCAGTGQDGDVQAGVAWPVPRFEDNGDGTITDHLTGLIWLKNANCFGERTWSQALADSNSLASGSCGLSDGSVAGDWRLPNVVELESLVNAGVADPLTWLNAQGFAGGDPTSYSTYYWSATTNAHDTSRAWHGIMSTGGVYHNVKTLGNYVWPVRGGQGGSFGILPRTGQKVSYAAGDDGALQTGTAWPAPRFTDNGDGTVTDHLTGLIWLKNPNCFGVRTWDQALSDANTLAHKACGLTDRSQAGDWRLPNRKELLSLIDYSQFNPALPHRHPFASGNGHLYPYLWWSASTFAFTTSSTSSAWLANIYYGGPWNGDKTFSFYVWPVRGGQGGDWECVSDLDGDGDVDGFDLMLFMHAYNDMSTDADISGDGLINSQDLAIFAAEFGQGSCDPDGG